jgi:hypothetical protein
MGYFLRDFWAFLQGRQKYWLLPLVLSMLILGALLMLVEGSAIAPFIYTLF